MASESMAVVTVPDSPSSSVEKCFPPGFRFHPTDEELVLYYLKQKVRGRSLKLDIIGEIDVCKWEPEGLPGLAKWKTGDRQWFFFTHRDKKYPHGGRSNRGTLHGYWKATGKYRVIKNNSRTVGLKKTLVYYKGRAPSGQRTDWVLHEYTMDEEELKRCKTVKGNYALCKFFKKSGAGPKNGEQYGAPFVEEEWDDDNNEDGNCLNVESLLVNNINTRTTSEPEIVPPLAVQSGSDPLIEPSEITCVEEVGPQPLLFDEDFLELDDLSGPQPTLQDLELPMLDDLPFGDYNQFCLSDFFDEPINPFKSQHGQQPYTNVYDLWGHDQENEDFTNPSGVIEKSGIPDSGVNGKTEEDDGTELWFASSLWGFVESIPTKPASALESCLFDRILKLVESVMPVEVLLW